MYKHVSAAQTAQKILSVATFSAAMIMGSMPVRTILAQQNGQGNCGDGAVAKVESSPFQYSGSSIITSIFVKAGSAQSTGGNQCTQFTTDGSNDCYSVTGLGTPSVSVERIGSGNTCKEISHVEFYAAVETSPTPTPSSTPEATASALVDPSPEPTSTPSASPVPSPTPVVAQPTPTPTSTPKTENKSDNGGTGGGDVLGASTTNPSNPPAQTGDVLGYATTGAVEDVMMNAVGLLGAAFMSVGTIIRAKAHSYSNKK